MKRIIFKSKKILSTLFIILFALICLFEIPISKVSHATNETITIDSSKFLYSPTYSFVFGDYVFCVDNFEENNYLKKFAITPDSQSSNNPAEYSKLLDTSIVDAYFLGSKLFILSETELYVLNLISDLNPIKIYDLDISYKSIFAFETNDYYLLTLTPTNTKIDNILILTLSKYDFSVLSYEIDNQNYLKSDENDDNILVVMIETQNKFCLLYFGAQTLKYNIISELGENIVITNSPTDIANSNLEIDQNTNIINVSLIEIDESQNFLITYQKETAENGEEFFSLVYAFDFSQENSYTFSKIEEIGNITTSKFVLTSKNSIIYPTTNTAPQIIIETINDNIFDVHYIENPTPTISEFYDSEYKFMSTISETALLSKPWEISSDIIIPISTDIIVIGTAKINDTKIDGIYYCLYTSKNDDLTFTDNYGYIRDSYLAEKDGVELSDLNLPSTVKVHPNTFLYSMPSKASQIKLETDGNYAVEINDTLCGYKTDVIKWLNVRIGNSNGYIDISRIDYSSEKIDFIETNAKIMKDNTYVHSKASSSSDLIYYKPLNKGKAVYIDGVRDTKTGWTKIKFNDDYGNVFEGYINTENAKTDSWTRLQIIGCILIAINVGLLILILIYKKNKLGKDGTKIQQSNVDISNE